MVGDIILLKMGEQVPADIRLFDARNFKVDNSSLTGKFLILYIVQKFLSIKSFINLVLIIEY